MIAKNPNYTSQLLAYRDEFIFTDCSIRKYWDDVEKLWVDRDVNAAINLKRLGLRLRASPLLFKKQRTCAQSVFPSIKRRKGIPVVVGSITDDTSKEVLRILRSA